MNDYMCTPYNMGQFNNSRDFESGFMSIENPFPGDTFADVFTNPKRKSVSAIRSEIENTLTAAEYKTLIGTRFISGKDTIIKYRDVLTKLIDAGVFDDVSVDTHENVINRYGQMKVNPWPSSTCETCVACDDDCDETESDCDDDNSSDSSTKREIVLTQAFEFRKNFIHHDSYIRSTEDCEVPNQSFEIGIDDPEKPINYSTVSDMFTTILRICLDHVVERTAAINMVMELMSEIGDEANSTLIAYCDSDCAEKLKDYIDTLYNNEIKVAIIGAPDHVIGIRVNLPGNEMVAIPLVLHVMSYLWADIPNSYDATPTPPSSDGFDVRRVLDLI